MHDLIPFIPGSVNDVLGSLPFFLPEIYLTGLFILVLITDLLFGRNSEKLCRIIAFAGILLVIQRDYQQIQLLFMSGRLNGQFLFNEMLLLNRIAINFKFIIDALAFVLLLYFGWDNRLKSHPKGLSDLYTIVIGSVLGLHLMAMAVNLLSIYLAIEMVSIASYLMVAYRSESTFGVEAGLKYVLFGAASSAMMLYGISLLYGFTGSLNLFSGNLLPGLIQANPVAVSFALVLVLVGIGFKLSFVPIHFWARGRLTINEHGNRRVTRLEEDGTISILADRYEGSRLNSPNDLVYRSDGTLYFTDPPFGLPKFFNDPRKELPFSGVYSLKEGKLLLIATDLRGPNGIAFSPDEKYLYVTNWEEKRKVILRYESHADGTVSGGQVFFDMTAAPGEDALDGLKVDVKGNLYVSGPGGLWILSPEGKHLGTVVGPRHPHNMAWGGDDGRTLYLCAESGLYRMPLRIPGVRP